MGRRWRRPDRPWITTTCRSERSWWWAGRSWPKAQRGRAHPDPTAHAELLGCGMRGGRAGTDGGLSTHAGRHPRACAMCAGALLAARVWRLVFGAPTRGWSVRIALQPVHRPSAQPRDRGRRGRARGEAAALLERFFAETARRATLDPSKVAPGGLPEWTKGAASKAVVASGTVGSNSTPSPNLLVIYSAGVFTPLATKAEIRLRKKLRTTAVPQPSADDGRSRRQGAMPVERTATTGPGVRTRQAACRYESRSAGAIP